MQKPVYTVFILLAVVAGFAFIHTQKQNTPVTHTINYFKTRSVLFANAAKELRQSVMAINASDSTSIFTARQKLADCRKAFKFIEFFSEYFFEPRMNIFNLPPVFEVEEPFMEYQWPVGLQVVEGLLYDDPVNQQKDILTNLEVVITTAEGLPHYLYGKEVTEAQVLESMRLELIRVSTLSISGFDAPLLKTGILEAAAALEAINHSIQPWLQQTKGTHADSVSFYLERSIQILNANPHFDSFDRMHFLMHGMLPLQSWLGKFIKQSNLLLNTSTVLNYDKPHILSKHAISVSGFHPNNNYTPEMALLGKKLFSETMLSGNNKRSCLSCHEPARYFTDGLQKSTAFDGHNTVNRNAPSLLYAAYQHGFFLDGRAPSLEEQVLMVLGNPTEMNVNFLQSTEQLKGRKVYRRLFEKAFPAVPKDSLFTPQHIAAAIAAYEVSLPVMNSAFDRYIGGDRSALSPRQLNGFNLFMGKALCGTCHFLPLFNGLLPPLYNLMELESLGMLTNNNFTRPVADTDSGRFHFFPIEFYAGVFKTPTVRNIAKTAPYMHNGAFASLHEVLQFYNLGGGKGMGLDMPYQTLSEKPLDLSENEINELVDFMESLTDEQ